MKRYAWTFRYESGPTLGALAVGSNTRFPPNARRAVGMMSDALVQGVTVQTNNRDHTSALGLTLHPNVWMPVHIELSPEGGAGSAPDLTGTQEPPPGRPVSITFLLED